MCGATTSSYFLGRANNCNLFLFLATNMFLQFFVGQLPGCGPEYVWSYQNYFDGVKKVFESINCENAHGCLATRKNTSFWLHKSLGQPRLYHLGRVVSKDWYRPPLTLQNNVVLKWWEVFSFEASALFLSFMPSYFIRARRIQIFLRFLYKN